MNKQLFSIVFCVSFVAVVCVVDIAIGQSSEETFHASQKGAWGGTGNVCNVCHEPFQAHYSNRQPSPFQNHQVVSPTFRGNKLDGAPVMIRPDKGGDKCQSCHQPTIPHTMVDLSPATAKRG